MEFHETYDFAVKCDRDDVLKTFRDEFFIPKQDSGAEYLYFTGNSLGLQPRTTQDFIMQELDDWALHGVEGHFNAQNPWMPYHELLTSQSAKLVGAKPSEVVVMNSLTVNLHLLMVSFYRPNSSRYKIMIEADAFPSDKYAVQSQIEFHQKAAGILAQECFADALIELAPRSSEATLRTADIVNTIEENAETLSLILLGGVNYFTGQAFDMRAITEAGHKHGITVGFDLAHAAGNLLLKLHEWNVDFAAWCSYKYLNSGPGGIAGVYLNERHANDFDLPRFAGWWGHEKETRFLMPDKFQPMAGAEGWQLSNPPIFQMAALRASLEIFERAGLENLRAKSIRLTGYLEFLLNKIGSERIEVITPSNAAERGCQLSIRVLNSDKSLFDELTKNGVISDWREPDVIRVAPVPLYNSFEDVWKFAEILKRLLLD
ncbi:MAG: kynureninase [Pyrinomonadaceae bacterium]